MALVRDILAWLDLSAPFRYAESWDNCGLQVGDQEALVTRVLVALDPNSATLNEAEEQACECLVTHHPLLFSPLKAVRADQFPGNLVIRAVLKGIHVIAAHTNLDVARGGTNDHLGHLLSVQAMEPLERDDSRQEEDRYGGMGRIGFLPEAIRFNDLVKQTMKVLGGSPVRAVGNGEKQVHRVALCSGSGGGLIEQAISLGSDVFITGDVKYHDAQRALEAGLALIDIGHFASERIVVRPLAACLRAQAVAHHEALEVLEASGEKDPFRHWSLDGNV
jgi:dinuclear metal center YbgI/SA1388 family protein